MNNKSTNTNNEHMGMNPQRSAQQAGMSAQQVRMNFQQPSMSTLPPSMSIHQPISLSSLQPSMSLQHPIGMSTLQPNVGILQTSMSIQQPIMSIHQPIMSIHQPSMSIQQASMSTQQGSMSTQRASSSPRPSTSSQQPIMSTQEPGMSTQQPSISSQQMNLTAQQLSMLNQMNMQGHPITIMSTQPIAMNISNQPMSIHAPQIALALNPQVMNINLHTQPIPINLNTQHLINLQSPHLNVHAPQLNLIHQPININAQHLNLHPQQMGMSAQQYNMHQMRLHQQIAAQQMHAQQMYMNQQQINANTRQMNTNTRAVAATTAQQAAHEEVPNPQPLPEPVDRARICQWLLELNESATRENALIELCRRREHVSDLAVLIWHGFGTAAALLQEIMNIYPAINPAVLTAAQSNRVCNALALLQCVAAHPETRPLFIAAQFPLFIYPFLHTISRNRPFEYLRLTCLGVIGALVKNDDPEVVQYLLDTEIIPLCLRIMESGSELSKIVATFILQKILANERGLNYICETYERFSHIAMILGKLVLTLAAYPSARLLKHIVKCYLRLSEHPRAREALRQCLPDQLSDATFNDCLQDDPVTRSWIAELLVNLEIPTPFYDPRQPSKPSSTTH